MTKRTADYPSRSIFICYRRDDSRDISGRIYDRLIQHFSKDAVFKDIDSIPFGVDFEEHVRGVLQECKVVLVVIGPSWADVVDEHNVPRLDDPADNVRIEVEVALSNPTAKVVPVLVNGARMRQAQLPASLAPLCKRNGPELRSDATFDATMDRLVGQIASDLKADPRVPPPRKPPGSFGRLVGGLLGLGLLAVAGWFAWPHFTQVRIPDPKPGTGVPSTAIQLLTDTGAPLNGATIPATRVVKDGTAENGIYFPFLVKNKGAEDLQPLSVHFLVKGVSSSSRQGITVPPVPPGTIFFDPALLRDNPPKEDPATGFTVVGSSLKLATEGRRAGEVVPVPSAAVYAGAAGVIPDGPVEFRYWVKSDRDAEVLEEGRCILTVAPAGWKLANPRVKLLTLAEKAAEEAEIPASSHPDMAPEKGFPKGARHGLNLGPFWLEDAGTTGIPGDLGVRYYLKAVPAGSPGSEKAAISVDKLENLWPPTPEGFTTRTDWGILYAADHHGDPTIPAGGKRLVNSLIFYVGHNDDAPPGHISKGVHEVGVEIYAAKVQPDQSVFRDILYRDILKVKVESRIPAQ